MNGRSIVRLAVRHPAFASTGPCVQNFAEPDRVANVGGLQSGPERVALCNLGHFFEADEIDAAEPGEAGDGIQCDWTIRAGVLENHDGLWKQRDHFLEELLVLVDQRSIVEV